MTNETEKINQLLGKLDLLLQRQEQFTKEINTLKEEIYQLTQPADTGTATSATVEKELKPEPEKEAIKSTPPPPLPVQTKETQPPEKTVRKRSNLEKFIGENLINKIGIIVTIIGVGIGAKYAIDNELISPLTRIILGYLVGAGLLGFAIRLRKNYENFSAVLLSGSMAIFYFITYIAFSFYELIPQLLAFSLMVFFTAFTVLAALRYNRQIIAHIGLVGAYAVPFLLGGEGPYTVLFVYMTIINTGILIIAFRKYWKPLYYVAFGLTWLIYAIWVVEELEVSSSYGLAYTFLGVYFTIFYLTFLGYKLFQKHKLVVSDVILLLANSFIFYGLGYAILSTQPGGEVYLGLFTLLNGVIHFVVSAIIYRQELGSRQLFYLVSGLVLVFLTIAIPVQLDGNWVTLLWVAEAALLFWIGRTRNVPVYETLSYPVMILAVLSLINEWSKAYYGPELPNQEAIRIIFNPYFLTSVLASAGFGFMLVLNRRAFRQSETTPRQGSMTMLLSYVLPVIFLGVLYQTFRNEIVLYWDQLYVASHTVANDGDSGFNSSYRDTDLLSFQTLWLINYTLLFLAALSYANIRWLKNEMLAVFNLIINSLAIIVFLTMGLYELSILRDNYIEQNLAEYFNRGRFNVLIRYICYIFVAINLYCCYLYIRQSFVKIRFKIPFDFLLHMTILVIASNELINWMDLVNSADSYKLGLSILWGVYALVLISLGIWQKKQYLRVAAIVLFAATLVKLFLYDISHLNTISKTIVFVSLGLLLLVISFLYNKYKHIIADDDAESA